MPLTLSSSRRWWLVSVDLFRHWHWHGPDHGINSSRRGHFRPLLLLLAAVSNAKSKVQVQLKTVQCL